MINWLRRLWHRRQYHIYVFWDGTKIRREDPIVLMRALRLVEDFNLEEDIPLIVKGDEDACSRAVAAARKVFSIEKFDGSRGLTEEATLDVFAGFMVWCENVKKNSRALPTMPESTEPPPPLPADGSTITSCSAPCSSSSEEPNCAAPAASAPESLVPLSP